MIFVQTNISSKFIFIKTLMNAAFVRVLKVTNFPKFTGSSLCGYRVLVRFLPKDEESDPK